MVCCLEHAILPHCHCGTWSFVATVGVLDLTPLGFCLFFLLPWNQKWVLCLTRSSARSCWLGRATCASRRTCPHCTLVLQTAVPLGSESLQFCRPSAFHVPHTLRYVGAKTSVIISHFVQRCDCVGGQTIDSTKLCKM